MNYIKPVIDALEVSIFSPLKDLILEYAQLEIDKIFENTVLRKIPIINTLAAFYEVGANIRERNFAKQTVATVYKGNIIKNLIMDCQSYTKYRPNETTGGIFVSWRRKEELPTGA